MAADEDLDEVVSCMHCGHCTPVDGGQCNLVATRLTPYGRWQRYRQEVVKAMGDALRRFGVCEVRCGLVDLLDLPCGHFWDGG